MPDSASQSSALALSPDDIRRLLEDASTQTRIDITQKIAASYGTQELHDREYKVAEQIFRLLLRDTEIKVRATLAEQIKSSTVIPRDIVLKMARDVESVSLPVLEFSAIFTDDDLVDLIQSTQATSRHLAVTKRRNVSQLVSNALLATNNDMVATSLVKNNGADIAAADLTLLIDKNSANNEMMEAMGARSKLPLAAAEKLVSIVSGSLAEALKKKYQLATSDMEAPVAATRESETLDIMQDMDDDEAIERLVSQMHTSDRLSPSIILSSLCQGNFAFFEASLARLSNIPINNVRQLISDKGELGFRALYNKSGLPDTMFPAVRMLLRVVREMAILGERPGKARFANNVVERLLHAAEDEPVENLSYIIALVRRSA